MKLWSIVGTFLEDARVHWMEAPMARRTLYGSGLSLIASGLFHLGIYLSQRNGWSGPVSWRKPILFGFSGGVTALSAGWASGMVADTDIVTRGATRKWERYFDIIFATAILTEVGLITGQTWRGRASHFNNSNRTDASIAGAIDILILLLTLQALNLTIRVMRPIRSGLRPRDEVLALRLGLLLFLLGCGLGLWTLIHGRLRAMEGLDPTLIGERGVMKFPHGLPIHALQVLPLMSWLMHYVGVREDSRVHMIITSASGFLLLTSYGMGQTLRGKARFEIGPISAVILVVSVGLIAAPLIAVTAIWRGWTKVFGLTMQ